MMTQEMFKGFATKTHLTDEAKIISSLVKKSEERLHLFLKDS